MNEKILLILSHPLPKKIFAFSLAFICPRHTSCDSKHDPQLYANYSLCYTFIFVENKWDLIMSQKHSDM